jgi:hypothetical protein
VSADNEALFAEHWPEADLRIKRLENLVVQMTLEQVPLGVCVNARCGAPRHPHWLDEPQVAWSQTIIYPAGEHA